MQDLNWKWLVRMRYVAVNVFVHNCAVSIIVIHTLRVCACVGKPHLITIKVLRAKCCCFSKKKLRPVILDLTTGLAFEPEFNHKNQFSVALMLSNNYRLHLYSPSASFLDHTGRWDNLNG